MALDLQRAFIGDNQAQRPRRRAPRIDELARQRGRPGPVVQVPRPRFESDCVSGSEFSRDGRIPVWLHGGALLARAGLNHSSGAT